MKLNLEKIKQEAEKEIEEECYRQEVELMKKRLREKRPFLDKLFPYKIIIIKKGVKNARH